MFVFKAFSDCLIWQIYEMPKYIFYTKIMLNFQFI
jgi:hypothetical protein